MAVCAVATIATCGWSMVGATAAINMVASGTAALTTASTVAAAATIGSATCLAVAAMDAAVNSNSVSEFCDQGNWGTVAATAGGAVLGGGGAYLSTRSSPTCTSSGKKTPVIGKMKDLNKIEVKPNEFKVADLLPDMGNPKLNWKQNSSVLRSFADGRPIRDVSPYPMQNAGFLGAERNLLSNRGYQYSNGIWIMP